MAFVVLGRHVGWVQRSTMVVPFLEGVVADVMQVGMRFVVVYLAVPLVVAEEVCMIPVVHGQLALVQGHISAPDLELGIEIEVVRVEHCMAEQHSWLFAFVLELPVSLLRPVCIVVGNSDIVPAICAPPSSSNARRGYVQ